MQRAPTDSSVLDERALERYWQHWVQHHEPLRRMALRWMHGDVDEAEDALGDAALRGALKAGLPGYRIVDLRAWLRRLLHNCCMDRYRRRAGGIKAATRVLRTGVADALVGRTPGCPEALVVERETFRALEGRFGELPDEHRRALVARCVAEESYRDIAATAGITPANARKRVQLARAALRHGVSE